MFQITFIITLIHVLYCPFTKVEESFNLQAMHDLLYLRENISQYDHHEFPGVVPRSFIGPLFVSFLCGPIVWCIELLDLSKFWSQYIVRLTLACYVLTSFYVFQRTLKNIFGQQWVNWFLTITVSQYHFMYYLSRPLPNIMVLPLVLFAVSSWINRQQARFIFFSGAAIIIFRAELAMFLGFLLLHDLYFKSMPIKQLFQLTIPAGVLFLSLTVIIDSLFWRRLLWPEGEVFWFNTILNKSSEWGTQPFLWYFYSAIPRGLATSFFLVPVGFILDLRVRRLVWPGVVYTFFFSFLPHKELRFIIYIFPLFNIGVASACHRLWENRKKSSINTILALGILGHIIANICFTLFLMCISSTNYPGGTAISRLHRIAANESNINVHIDVLTAQTGVSRFTQIRSDWTYNKSETLEPATPDILQFKYLLTEAKSKYSSNLKPYLQTHDIIESIDGFSHISLNYNLLSPIKIKMKPMIFILKRKENATLLESINNFGHGYEIDEENGNYPKFIGENKLVENEEIETQIPNENNDKLDEYKSEKKDEYFENPPDSIEEILIREFNRKQKNGIRYEVPLNIPVKKPKYSESKRYVIDIDEPDYTEEESKKYERVEIKKTVTQKSEIKRDKPIKKNKKRVETKKNFEELHVQSQNLISETNQTTATPMMNLQSELNSFEKIDHSQGLENYFDSEEISILDDISEEVVIETEEDNADIQIIEKYIDKVLIEKKENSNKAVKKPKLDKQKIKKYLKLKMNKNKDKSSKNSTQNIVGIKNNTEKVLVENETDFEQQLNNLLPLDQRKLKKYLELKRKIKQDQNNEMSVDNLQSESVPIIYSSSSNLTNKDNNLDVSDLEVTEDELNRLDANDQLKLREYLELMGRKLILKELKDINREKLLDDLKSDEITSDEKLTNETVKI